jgi:glycosyltransferase involved in cell wall biosynthesis
MTSAPRVTLAMPVYNGENFIRKAIESLLAQTFEDFELIISDNASSDSTREIITSYQRMDSRIRLIKNARNLGAAENQNLGFRESKGEYFKWCAHDDEIDPAYIEKLVAKLDENPELSLAFGKTICIDATGCEIPMIGKEMPEMLSADPVERFFKSIMLMGACFPIFGLFRRDVLVKTTLHRPYYGSDRALLVEVALLGKLGFVPDVTFFNRDHDQRSLMINDKLEKSLWQYGVKDRRAAAEHLNFLQHLFEIARRHPDVASPVRLQLAALRFALEPYQIGRYVMECTGFVSPGTARLMKWSADRLFRPTSGFMKPFKGNS